MINPIGTDEQIRRNLPSSADLMNHLDRQRPPPRQDFRRARTRAQEVGKLCLCVPHLFNRMVEDVNWIKVLVDIDGPLFLLVGVDKGKKHVQSVAFLCGFGSAPASLDLLKRSSMILFSPNRSNIHRTTL